MPRVSVIIPCYNLGAFLEEAIASVRAQTVADYEIIVVDDGSDDSLTLEKLAALENEGLHVLRTENRGVAAARNHGIAAARGRYVLPLDADDRIAPSYLQQAVEVLDSRPEIGVVYCQAELFGERCGAWNIPEFSFPHQLIDNLIFCAALYRREDWEQAGGYDETMRSGWEDWEFWIRLLGLGRKVFRLPETLFSYRIRRDSRDRSLDVFSKSRLFLKIVRKNLSIYLTHGGALLRILFNGDRRRPDEIRINHV